MASSVTLYSLDTNVFMDWQSRFYPVDLFVALSIRMESLVAHGTVQAVDLVQEEIDAVGTPELRAWAKAHRKLFVPLAPDVQLEAASIEAAYPELMDPKVPYQAADAYVIALARLRDGIVITQETSVEEKHRPKRSYYIPDVCRNLGVPCINFLGMMRREKWQL